MTPLRLVLISVVFGLFPLLIALLAILIANLCGCRLDEAEAGKCVVFGKDIGGLLYGMFVFGWMGMITGGIGVLGVMAGAIWGLLRWLHAPV